MQTWHIHIKGQVQGVGFRPFVYGLAQAFGLKGWVNNTVDGVHIEINADLGQQKAFAEKLIQDKPVLAQITGVQITQINQKFFDNFQIIHSEHKGKSNLLLTPDAALCNACRSELLDKKDRRSGYSFITCTNCGPRYSIITGLPFDRPVTTMAGFKMCKACQEEYDNPLDRRYYSQTNSCKDCGVKLSLYNQQKQLVSAAEPQIIDQVIDFWRAGNIIAIKGIGGYLLTCDATNKKAIDELRLRKHRPTKPFALMFPNIEDVKATTNLSSAAIKTLDYPVSPIVLSPITTNTQQHIALAEIAPKLSQIGIMLPYTPLFESLLHDFGRPIVATSGNISGSPIIYQDDKALLELGQIADYLLVNNRDIVVPQDDSVIRFSLHKTQKIILRRSRGLAPTYINPDLETGNQRILAMGAMLKSTFCILNQGNVYISQYLGDLGHFDTEQNYEKVLNHLLRLFGEQPELILMDLHPQYPSTLLGAQLAKKLNIKSESVQHHIAHFASIIGEHNLIHIDEPILGVVWDGTGLGTDGQIWGGEFFLYQNYQFQRVNHFEYFDFILGDKMPKEPRISALSVCWEIEGVEKYLREKFSKMEWQIYASMLNKKSGLKTSSVGRLFDAIASVLGLKDKQSYEGEAAILLETLATQHTIEFGLDKLDDYLSAKSLEKGIPTKSLIQNLLQDLSRGTPKAKLAANFHYSLVQSIQRIANDLKIKKVAFSGGCFQNGLLVDLILQYLHTDFELYFHQQLSPNDENISFGQLIYHSIQENIS